MSASLAIFTPYMLSMYAQMCKMMLRVKPRNCWKTAWVWNLPYEVYFC